MLRKHRQLCVFLCDQTVQYIAPRMHTLGRILGPDHPPPLYIDRPLTNMLKLKLSYDWFSSNLVKIKKICSFDVESRNLM